MGIPPELSPDHAELLQISWLNVCHRRDDLEPQTLGDQTIAESAEPKYDTEAASENVHLVTQNLSPDLVPDLPAPETESVNLLQLCKT